MSAPTSIVADVSAEVFRRVAGFAATRDILFYLTGVHIVPGPAGRDGQPLRMEASDGHLLYVEEDKSGTAQRELIVRVSKRGQALLRGSNRVKVFDNLAVHITNESGAVLYIEPEQGVVNGTFPQLGHLIGTAADWHEGLGGTVNTQYLLRALAVPGYVRFFSRKDADGRFDPRASVMFVMDGGTTNGGKAFGLIMPVRGAFGPHSAVADMLPRSLLVPDGAKAAA
ncbi:hypothetical protein [Dyella sp.]|uniref:hypothetical protein n=1 Tax=Dyella sp. TaxID=1869338 RepID=UPI003F81BA62